MTESIPPTKTITSLKRATHKQTNIMATKKKDESAELANIYAGMDFAADAAQDNGISADDCTIPRLKLIQSSSPQCKRGNEKYDEEAKEGDLYDSVNNRYFRGDTGVTVIPLCFKISYIEWKDRDAGGGLVANHGDNPSVLNNTTKNDRFKDITPEGNIIEKTAEYHVLMVDEEGNTSPYVISMSASQLKVSKDWNTMISLAKRQVPGGEEGQMFRPAMFFISYQLTTVPNSNAKGDSWMSFSVKTGEDVIKLPNGVAIYGEASSTADAIKSGEMKSEEHASDQDAL